jgi:tetratricopeptide (TPR) repeat protein
MTKEELMALLRNPDQTGQAVDELNRQIEENPYFHTGHQLYLKGLQQTNETKMALQLGKSALSVRDRGVLYNYLNSPSSFRRQPSPSDQPVEVSMPFIPGSSFVSPDVDIHNIQRIHPEPSSPGMHPLTTGGGWHNSEDGNVVAEEKIMSDDQLKDMIRRRMEEIAPQAETDSQAPTTTVIDVVETTSELVVTSVEQDVKPGDVGNTELAVWERPDVAVRNGYSEEQLAADLMKVKQVEIDIAANEKGGLASIDLIDSFLKINPKIIPRDSNYEVNLSESLQEDPNIATETLADIYAMQGHKDKAIEIYEHLILRYPEKRIYFAVQIDRLKE